MTAGAPVRVSTDMARARRARTVIGLTVVLPFALAALLSVWRLGADARGAAGARTVAAAETAAAIIEDATAGEAARPGGQRAIAGQGTRRIPGASAIRGGLASLVDAGFAAGWYDARRGFARSERTVAAPTLPAAIPTAVLARLESLDRAFTARIGGRTVAVAPVKDADRWDQVGALLVVPDAREPAQLPPLALAVAGIAIALIAVGGRACAARSGPARAALLIPPAAAFAVWMIRADLPPGPLLTAPAAIGTAPLAGGSHGFWTAVLLAGWAVIAGIGLSLARTASSPLRLREAARAWAFLAPSFAHLLVFSLGPILFALWLSFHEWNLLSPARPFVGLENYRELAGDAGFWRAVRNTAVYVLFVPAGMLVALALALLANRRIPGVNLLRTVFFLPYVTSFVAISLVWKWMFQPDVGLLNSALARIGIAAQPWLSSPATALPSLMLMSIWMYAGYMMVIFLAGLQSIPASLYESARIDGAGPWQRFRHITLPMLRPTLLFILVTMVIFMFQVFTAVYVMTEGGPLHATDVVVYHIYRNAWEYLRMGYASAMAWVLFAIVFAITLIQFRWLGGRPAQ